VSHQPKELRLRLSSWYLGLALMRATTLSLMALLLQCLQPAGGCRSGGSASLSGVREVCAPSLTRY
jgi:hypothetical protein